MTRNDSKLEILKKVSEGVLSVEEGADLIGILERAGGSHEPMEASDPAATKPGMVPLESPRVSGCWKAAWSTILLGGAVLTAFSAYWVYQGFQKGGFGWGFWMSWIPFLIGLGLTIFGWILMDSPWMHIRVNSHEDSKSQKFVISIPLPIHLALWVMRTFRNYIPSDIKEKGVEEMLMEINNSMDLGEPFTVEVDEKEDGDQVYIHISK